MSRRADRDEGVALTVSWTSFLDRFAEVVQRHPNRAAVLQDGARSLSYAALHGWAARLGESLSSLGAGPECVVGLALHKSPEYLAALLGAWWAGAAVLPLEPSLPAERLALIVRDSGMKLVVASAERTQRLKELGLCPLDPRASASENQPPARLALSRPRPQDLAYVIYTSGTTGRPKGILVPQRGIVNLLDAQIPVFGLGPDKRALWFLSSAFDASFSDLGTTLLSAATLCIEPEEELRSGPGLVRALGRLGITHLDLPPALLRVLDPATLPECLETLIIGGEACAPALVRQWARRFRVVNVYGPTEATVCSSLCICTPETWDQPLLGQPIPGVTYHVLDSLLQPVPACVPGELAISGVGLARGYLNQPELSARKFFHHAGERLFRTGDRVVRRADGEYVFLGRLDRQVKLRGLRIEPEEIEARLLEHPQLVQAAVLKRKLPGSTAVREGLVAFVASRSPACPPKPREVRGFLARTLPRWMIPQWIEFLEHLPHTSTGKIDLVSLAGAELGRTDRAVRVDGPATEEEVVLTEIWGRILGLESVSRNAGFFEQGGDSLGLLEAVAAAHARGLLLPPSLIAEDRTIPDLAAWLQSQRRLPQSREEDAARGEPPPGALACTELRKEAAIAADWKLLLESARARPPLPNEPAAPRAIFLTGSTGFLGARLLFELLQRTHADVFCLVRADGPGRGMERLSGAWENQGLSLTPGDRERIRIVPGDLARPLLGLSQAVWDHLAADVDTVYHCGAWVNMVLPYSMLRPSNVLGTREILRFLCSGCRKRLHYASTLSVFVASDRNQGKLLESDALLDARWVYGGYAQTKWAAEWLLRSLANAAGPVTYFRLGLLTGDARTGRAAPNDFLTLFVRGLVRVGCVPRLDAGDLFLDVTPLDFAAAALAHLSLRAPSAESLATFHLANPQSLSLRELIQALEAFGVRLPAVSPARWRERLGELECGAPEAAAACLALCRSMSDHRSGFELYRTMDLFQATGVEFGMENTLAGLAGSGLVCPVPDLGLLQKYLSQAFPGGPYSEHG